MAGTEAHILFRLQASWAAARWCCCWIQFCALVRGQHHGSASRCSSVWLLFRWRAWRPGCTCCPAAGATWATTTKGAAHADTAMCATFLHQNAAILAGPRSCQLAGTWICSWLALLFGQHPGQVNAAVHKLHMHVRNFVQSWPYDINCQVLHVHRLEPGDSAEQEALQQRRTTSSDLGGGRSVRRHTMGRQTSFGTTL